jgi:hypothetical protein
MLLKADEIKRLPKKIWSSNFGNYIKKYYSGTNVESDQLYHQSIKTKVPIYKEIFDIIHHQHKELGHQHYSRPKQQQIDWLWFGIADDCIKIYSSLCPDCLPSARVPKEEKLH